ncbi:hypothetical protein BS50DRAFT_296392 [Corynespora cassiicola Philippines]|uniref:Uncharacterized protein n=1 Tax=Corynespora cassiicola Philippines TaxID=1448308 RepID=A0A2T2NWJ9_CORCC|nr:hypothetical protein BS50DRAFT_296392 [Corynespora cassiicola Philippines]
MRGPAAALSGCWTRVRRARERRAWSPPSPPFSLLCYAAAMLPPSIIIIIIIIRARPPTCFAFSRPAKPHVKKTHTGAAFIQSRVHVCPTIYSWPPSLPGWSCLDPGPWPWPFCTGTRGPSRPPNTTTKKKSTKKIRKNNQILQSWFHRTTLATKNAISVQAQCNAERGQKSFRALESHPPPTKWVG